MGMPKAMRQKPGRTGRTGVAHDEAVRDPVSDEACGPPRDHPDTGLARQKAGAGTLLEVALTRENLHKAWKRVKANKGAAGSDELDIEQTAEVLRRRWSDIRQALLAGTYRPAPVRRVMIPKPDGSQRELGIPTVLDRLIQQALLQVLQPLIDRSFSEHSHGFRPGRRARDAVKAARAYVQSGKRVVVDVDLAKFFDRVNHDILIDRLRIIEFSGGSPGEIQPQIEAFGRHGNQASQHDEQRENRHRRANAHETDNALFGHDGALRCSAW